MSVLIDALSSELKKTNSKKAKRKQAPEELNSENIEFEQIQKHFSDSAHTYKQGAQLQNRVGQALFAKLMAGLMTKLPSKLPSKQHNLTCVDLGCGPGLFTPILNQHFNQLISLDLSPSMLQANDLAEHKVQANSHALPFLAQSVDVFYSSLMVQWCDLQQVLQQMHAALKPNGKVFIATLVDETLFELKQAWAKVDIDEHIHQYLTPNQIDTIVSKQAWSEITLSQSTEVFWFDNVKLLAKELKSLGANFVQNRKNKGLMTKSKWLAMEQAYREAFYDDSQKAIPASYRVMYIELSK